MPLVMSARFVVVFLPVKDSTASYMADLSRVDRRVAHQGDAKARQLRQNRRSTKGAMRNTSTGFITRDRRGFMDRYSREVTGIRPHMVRKRLRYGWTLQESITASIP